MMKSNIHRLKPLSRGKVVRKRFHSFPDRNGRESKNKNSSYTMESSIRTLLNIDALNKLAASAETPGKLHLFYRSAFSLPFCL